MSTSTRATGHKRPSHPDIPHAVRALETGGVVIFPTETVYGIGTSVFSLTGIQRIYHLKGRQGRKPLALLVPNLEAARPLVEDIPIEAARLAKKFWPGPLTLVLEASALGRVVTGGLRTIGVRIPDHPIALEILRKVQIPLATTSVNRSGDKPAVTGTSALKLFGKHVDFVLDGGACVVKTASSVIDVSHYPFTVIREGAISKRTLEKEVLQ